jgi:prepilin-type processing-associated H-X9-DG protein
MSWVVKILPNIDKQDLHDEIFRGSSFQPRRIELLMCPANLPPQRDAPTMGYFVNAGLSVDATADEEKWSGVFFDRTRPRARRIRMSLNDIRDGASTTLLVSENLHHSRDPSGTPPNNFTWIIATDAAKPQVTLMWSADVDGTIASHEGLQADQQHLLPSSRHGGDFVVTFCDGHTDVLSTQLDLRFYRKMMTSDGGALDPSTGNPEFPEEASEPLEEHMLNP